MYLHIITGEEQVARCTGPCAGGEGDQPLLALRYLAVDYSKIHLLVHHHRVDRLYTCPATSQR